MAGDGELKEGFIFYFNNLDTNTEEHKKIKCKGEVLKGDIARISWVYGGYNMEKHYDIELVRYNFNENFWTIIKKEETMEKRKIELSIEEAQKLYEKGSTEFRKILELNFTKEELTSDKRPKSWHDLDNIYGCFTGSNSNINTISKDGPGSTCKSGQNKNVTTNIREAESMLALCQLKQLAEAINGESDDNWVDWTDKDTDKYYVDSYDHEDGTFNIDVEWQTHYFGVYFKRKSDAEFSMKYHRDLYLKLFKVVE